LNARCDHRFDLLAAMAHPRGDAGLDEPSGGSDGESPLRSLDTDGDVVAKQDGQDITMQLLRRTGPLLDLEQRSGPAIGRCHGNVYVELGRGPGALPSVRRGISLSTLRCTQCEGEPARSRDGVLKRVTNQAKPQACAR
jgi:hypothetical protein